MIAFFKNKFQEISFIGIILFAFIAFYIETDIYTPSFPQMINYFGTNEDTIQMLLSMNFLGLCLSCLFFGPASDAYGRKPILCSGLFIFMLGSIGCAVTDSLDWMIAFRFLQGVGCGSITSAGLTVLKNYLALLTNFPFMAHTLIWCLAFSMVIVFISNLSLIFVDHLQVPKEIFGYYQTAIMGAFFVGSMGGASLIKKIGMTSTKVIGSFTYMVGVVFLALLSFLAMTSPLLLIIAMSITSLGSALAMTIYFTYSMTYLSNHLKGSAMSLTQSLRLFSTSGLVWIAARKFDGSTMPMSVLAMVCTGVCIFFYVVLYVRKQHLSAAPCLLEK
ncbi:MAG TPA: MFS transporter [Chlamydiales bacterium]|nr:MFS transporter [Chlamydiales bacterium]